MIDRTSSHFVRKVDGTDAATARPFSAYAAVGVVVVAAAVV